MKLIKNYLYNVGYQIFVLLVPLITTPYISRKLGSNGVGINAYTNSIIQYFVLFGSIGISLYGNRTVAYERNDKTKMSQSFWEISILRFITILAAYAAFMVFFSFTKTYHEYYLYQSVQIIAAAFDISWLYMGLEDFKRTVLRNFLVKTVSVIAIFTFVKSSNDVGIYILILTLSTLLGNISLWGYVKHTVSKPDWRNLHLFKHVLPSVSLFVPQIATQIYLILNKTMLGSLKGVTSSGYYENSDKIVKIILAVVTATGTVMLPRMANTFASKNFKQLHRYLYLSFDFVSFISIPMAFGISAIAPKFATWFMGKDFAITGSLIAVEAIVIVLVAWSNVIGTQYLIPTNQTRQYTASVTAGAVVNLLLNIWMIVQYGVMGAIIATVASEFAVTAIQVYFIRHQISVIKLFQGVWKYLLSGTVMFLVVRHLNDLQKGSLSRFVFQVFAGAVIYIGMSILLRANFLNTALEFIKDKRRKK